MVDPTLPECILLVVLYGMVITVLLIRFGAGGFTTVDGESMVPKYRNGSWLAFLRLPLWLFPFRSGQDVVFIPTTTFLIVTGDWTIDRSVKQIIGLRVSDSSYFVTIPARRRVAQSPQSDVRFPPR